MKIILKIFIGLILLIILLGGLLFLTPFFLGLFSKDSLPPQASDLQLSIVSTVEDENSYYDLMKIENVLVVSKESSELINEYLEGKKWGDARVAQLLDDNQQALAYFASAAERSSYQDPAYADPSTFSINTILPLFSTFRTANNLSALKTLWLAKQGEHGEAIEQAFQNLDVARQMEQSQGPLIQYLVSFAIKNRGLTTIQNIVNNYDIAEGELRDIGLSLNNYYDLGEGLKKAFKTDFITRVSTLDMLSKGIPTELIENLGIEGKVKQKTYLNMINGRNKSFYFQPNKTKEYDVEYTRNMLSRAEQLCVDTNQTYDKKLSPHPGLLLFTENAIGKILHDVVSGSLDSIFDTRCSSNFQASAVRTLIAIKIYKNDTGNYPVSLSNLVPVYIERIPQDPYSGNDLLYSPSKKIIYSVGKKGVDVGGSEDGVIRNMENPTIRIEF